MRQKLVFARLLIVVGLRAACLVSKLSQTFQLTLVLGLRHRAARAQHPQRLQRPDLPLGHGAFYALGAYCAAILIDKAGAPYWA